MREIFSRKIFPSAGYRNVAVEQTYGHESLNSKNGNDQIPEPIKLDEYKEQINGKLNLFNRLTIEYSDPSVSHACGRSSNFKKYHLIAALPTTETALQHSCQMFQGDIITYNSDTVKIRLSRKFYYLAIRRNMFFELKYSPTIIDDNERRATITRAQQYHMIGKSRGIILTSEAKDSFHVRNPYDVACLGYIFGLSEEQGRCATSTLGRKCLLAAESRRLGKTPILLKFEDIHSSSSDNDDEMDFDVQSSSEENHKRKEKFRDNNKNSKKIKIMS